MNQRKVIVIVAVLVVLAVGLMLLNSVLNKDTLRPALQIIVANNETLLELSGEGSKGLSTYELQTQNATLFATTTSDSAQLKTYYKKRYHRDIKNATANTTTVASVHSAQPGSDFDSEYKDAVKKLLESNTASLKSVYESTRNTELRELADRVYTNQATALKLLN